MADRKRVEMLLTRRQVEEKCGISTSSIYRLLAAKQFPEPIRISARGIRWPESELQRWLESRPRGTGVRPW